MNHRRRLLRGLAALATLSVGFVVALVVMTISPQHFGGLDSE